MLDQRISASTLRFAVLGESLAHTWSPPIHNTLFRQAGIDAVYLPITVPKDRLASAVDVLRSCFAGFNVTIPYKEQIMPLLDELDETARACGAVNTVENRGGRLIGHITDGSGMLRAIQEGGIDPSGADVLILGGGGAARVAAYEFLKRGGRATLAVRSIEKGARLVRELADTQQDGSSRIEVAALHDLSDSNAVHDILVNCTPVGMYPNTNECPVDEAVITRCGAVFDAVYNPRVTKLLDSARRIGIPAIEGLGMLFYQAVEAEKHWFGEKAIASESVQRAVYHELLEQM